MNEESINKLKKAAGFLALIISVIFTWKLCKEAIGWETWDERFISVAIAFILNIIEVVCFAIWYFKKRWQFARWFAFLLGCAIALISVSGSMGYFQVKIERNVLNSDAYQLRKKQVESWLKMADKDSHPETYAWAATKAEKAAIELNNVTLSGAGVGNALYKVYARFFDTDTYTVGFWFTLFLAVSLEISGIFFLITSLVPSIKPQEKIQQKSKPVVNQNVSKNVNQKPPKPVTVYEVRSFTNDKKRLRIIELCEQHKNDKTGNPQYAKIAKIVTTEFNQETTRQTVYKLWQDHLKDNKSYEFL